MANDLLGVVLDSFFIGKHLSNFEKYRKNTRIAKPETTVETCSKGFYVLEGRSM